MIFRYYIDQLAKMEPAKRQQLEGRAVARTEKWIEVPGEGLESGPSERTATIGKKLDGAPKAASSYRPDVAPVQSLSGGPGDLVKMVLDKLGIKPKFNCGCDAMRRRMNEWGYRGCWVHREEIVEWFRVKAAEAGIEGGFGAIVNAISTKLQNRQS